VSLDQLKVMSAIERCRTVALGGHVARCENAACGPTLIAYNSCRNRHCPKCQGAASRRWLADREGELLPVQYFHVVYTLPSELRDIAYQNKRVVYDLLMKAAAETTLAIATDPKRLGARISVTAVLHTWGSALTHHPHVHMIVPGGGLKSRPANRGSGSAPLPRRGAPASTTCRSDVASCPVSQVYDTAQGRSGIRGHSTAVEAKERA